MNAQATLFSATGAELRALAAAGNADATSELARRKGKVESKLASGEKVRVASLTANGFIALANERIQNAKDKPSNVRETKPKAAVAFTRTTEVAIVSKRDTIAQVRKDFDGRVGAVEQAVLHLANLASTQAQVLERLVGLKGKKAV